MGIAGACLWLMVGMVAKAWAAMPSVVNIASHGVGVARTTGSSPLYDRPKLVPRATVRGSCWRRWSVAVAASSEVRERADADLPAQQVDAKASGAGETAAKSCALCR